MKTALHCSLAVWMCCLKLPACVAAGELGVGYVIVNPTPDAGREESDIAAALRLAEEAKHAGLTHLNLLGPLLFTSQETDEKIVTLVRQLKALGFEVSFCLNTFLDWGRRGARFAWVGAEGKPVDSDYFCLQRSRDWRLPEIERCIRKGIESGFDGVLLDFFDWGLDNLSICYCDACLGAFRHATGRTFSRQELARQLRDDKKLAAMWLAWKAKARNDMAVRIVRSAAACARAQKRKIWVGQCVGGIGSEPSPSGKVFDVHALMTYGSVAGGTIGSYDEIAGTYRQWRAAVGKRKRLLALLNAGWGVPPPADTPADELAQLAQAAIAGGADGWLFVPAEKIQGNDWDVLKRLTDTCNQLPGFVDLPTILPDGSGVTWLAREPGNLVVFAFREFEHAVPAAHCVIDLTCGGGEEPQAGKALLHTSHTYLLRPQTVEHSVSKHLISSVPYVPQSHPNTCGAAALAMLLRWAGKEVNEEALLNEYPRMKETGFYTPWLWEFPKKLGLQTESGEGDAAKVKGWLARHVPVLVYQKSTEATGRQHFRVVIGYDDAAQTFIVHDPAPQLGRDYRIPYDLFERLWDLPWFTDEKGSRRRLWLVVKRE